MFSTLFDLKVSSDWRSVTEWFISLIISFFRWQQCKIIGMHDGQILPFDSVMPSYKIQFLHKKWYWKVNWILCSNVTMNVPFWNELNSQQCNLAFDSVMSCIFFFNSDTSKWNSVDCFNVTSSNLLWSYFIFWRYLSPSLFSLRDKNNLELLERRILDWKNTKVAWGSRPWRAERRKCSSQIMFGSLNSISTLAKMLLMMMSVIIFGTKTYNNTSHWMMYDSVTPSTFLSDRG